MLCMSLEYCAYKMHFFCVNKFHIRVVLVSLICPLLNWFTYFLCILSHRPKFHQCYESVAAACPIKIKPSTYLGNNVWTHPNPTLAVGSCLHRSNISNSSCWQGRSGRIWGEGGVVFVKLWRRVRTTLLVVVFGTLQWYHLSHPESVRQRGRGSEWAMRGRGRVISLSFTDRMWSATLEMRSLR